MSVLLSWRQTIVLQAAASVNYLPFLAYTQINFPYGVWRALMIRGFIRKMAVPDGWEITELGREVLAKGVRLRRVAGNGGRHGRAKASTNEAAAGRRRCSA